MLLQSKDLTGVQLFQLRILCQTDFKSEKYCSLIKSLNFESEN